MCIFKNGLAKNMSESTHLFVEIFQTRRQSLSIARTLKEQL